MMNFQCSNQRSPARWIFTVVLLLVLFSRAPASAAQAERWLIIFNTSSAMKSRLPAVETEIKSLFATSFSQNLRAGDSVGVWTFDQQLRTGQFPLTTWAPENTVQTTSSLIAFLRKQRFSGNTSFAALQPLLGQLIADSERLTVVIICDGGDEIHWTPYDDGINETLNQTRGERKKSRQPYVLLIRTQLGKYISATVNFPPAPLNVPPFPPLPEETKAMPSNLPPKPVVPVETKPPVTEPSLIIVGTHVGTNLEEVMKMSAATNNPVAVAPPSTTNPPPVEVEAQQTNSISEPVPPAVVATSPPAETAVIAAAPKTNLPLAEIRPTNLISKPAPPVSSSNVPVAAKEAVVAAPKISASTETNGTVAASSAPSDNDTRILIYVGVGLFVVALVLVILFLVRGQRAPRGSLISRSMQDSSRPPDRK